MAKAMKFERQFMGNSGDVLLANPNMATLPASLHKSLPPWCVNTDMMADFRSQQGSKNSEMEQTEGGGILCSKDKPSAYEADDGLELSLGLSLGGYPGKSRESFDGRSAFGVRTKNICASGETVAETVKMEVEEKVAEEFASAKHDPRAHFSRSTCESQQDACLQKVHNPGIVHCWNEEDAKAEGGARPTAAQVWRGLQKSRATVSEMVVPPTVGESATAFPEAAAAVWAHMVRRSVSMQPMVASKDCNDAAPPCIRRSVSNGSSIIPQQLMDLPAAPLARPISRIEPLQDRAPDLGNAAFSQQHQEALELQRKKEVQARRRQEARKRRKILIEEKQHKRIRKEDCKVSSQARGSPTNTSQSKNSSAAVIWQDAFCSPMKESEGLERIGSKLSLHSWEAPAYVRGHKNEHAGTGDQVEERQKVLEIRRNTTQKREKGAGDKNKGGRSREAVKCANVAGPRMQGIQTARNKCESTPSRIMVDPDVRVQQLTRDATEWKPAKMNSVDEEEEGMASCQSSSNESESHEFIEEQNSLPLDSGNVDESNRKKVAPSNSHPDLTSMPLHPPMAFMNPSLPYTSPSFPVLPLPYPFSGPPGTGPMNLPVQMGFSVPCFMQFVAPLPSGMGETKQPGDADIPSAFQPPVNSGLPPYHFSIPEGFVPWVPMLPSHVATAQMPGSSVLRSTVTNADGDKKGSGGVPGKDARGRSRSPSSEPSLQPLQRMPSLSNSKDQAAIIGQGSKGLNDEGLGHPHAAFDAGCREKNGNSAVVSRLGAAHRHHSVPKTTHNQAHGEGTACSLMELKGNKVMARLPESGCDQVVNLLVPEEGRNFKGSQEQRGPDVAVAAVMEGSAQEVLNVQQDRAGQKFVDTGSLTELPLVSTTGVGPNGKTITGAMYILNRNQVRIVCTCHGQHLSPSEFVQHAGSTDLSNPERNIVVNPFPFLGQMPSAPP